MSQVLKYEVVCQGCGSNRTKRSHHYTTKKRGTRLVYRCLDCGGTTIKPIQPVIPKPRCVLCNKPQPGALCKYCAKVKVFSDGRRICKICHILVEGDSCPYCNEPFIGYHTIMDTDRYFQRSDVYYG